MSGCTDAGFMISGFLLSSFLAKNLDTFSNAKATVIKTENNYNIVINTEDIDNFENH